MNTKSILGSALHELSQGADLAMVYKPRLFDLSRASDRSSLEEMIRSGDVMLCHDTIEQQLAELIETRQPARSFEQAELEQRISDHLGGLAPRFYGTWVYYPWSRRLVHVLPADEYRELRNDRNRYKITTDEQNLLRTFTIGIVGLSVGHAIATMLAICGVGGRFRLAEFDHLSLSNLNRVGTGVHHLGIHKGVIAAREMFEIDPYLDISLYPQGITERNVEQFLSQGGKPDLLFEECDDLFMKIYLREQARKLGVAVVMATDDRGLIDIERFDREPGRAILHGLVGTLRAESLKGLSNRDKVPFVLQILGETTLSKELVASLFEIEQTLSSWPQLATDVALAGAVCGDVARRILLGQLDSSGRFYVDATQIVRDGAGVELGQPQPLMADVGQGAGRAAKPVLLPRAGEALSRDKIRSIVEHGILAPSGGNCQPWRFVYRHGQIVCIHDVDRSRSFLDFEHIASFLSFGAAVENMVLGATALGLGCELELFPDAQDAQVVCRLGLLVDSAGPLDSELLDQVPQRVTNRRLGKRVEISAQHAAALVQAASDAGARLQILTDPDHLREIGAIVGASERLRLLHQQMHHEMMAEIRFSEKQARATRDGLDMATLELSASDAAGLRLVRSWPAMKLLARLGGGRALERPSKKSMACASAAGLITVPGTGPESYFQAGRAMQRVWLRASAKGLVFQPITPILYLFARLERGGGDGFSQQQCQVLRDLRKRYLDLFDVSAGHAEAMLFRIAVADPPTAGSLRRRLDEVLVFE